MIGEGQWSQLASKWLTDPPGAWGIITNSGLVTAAGKLNSQRWLGDPMHGFNPVVIALSFVIPLNKD